MKAKKGSCSSSKQRKAQLFWRNDKASLYISHSEWKSWRIYCQQKKCTILPFRYIKNKDSPHPNKEKVSWKANAIQNKNHFENISLNHFMWAQHLLQRNKIYDVKYHLKSCFCKRVTKDALKAFFLMLFLWSPTRLLQDKHTIHSIVSFFVGYDDLLA